MPHHAESTDPSEPNADPITDPITDAAFRELFAAHEQAPAWLYHPARPLARAEEPGRSVADRLADLQQMSQEVDRIYRDYLPVLVGAGGQTASAAPSWAPALASWVETLNRRAAAVYAERIVPELAESGFEIQPAVQAMGVYGAWLYDYFHTRVYPLLIPLAVDPGRPFPHISGDSLNLLVELRDGSRLAPGALFARLKVPRITPRLIRLPTDATADRPQAAYVWSGDLVQHFIAELFIDMPVQEVSCFRLLRLHEADPASRAPLVQLGRRTRFAPVVRVDVERAMSPRLIRWLLEHLEMTSQAVVRYEAPLALMSLPQLAAEVDAWRNGAGAG